VRRRSLAVSCRKKAGVAQLSFRPSRLLFDRWAGPFKNRAIGRVKRGQSTATVCGIS